MGFAVGGRFSVGALGVEQGAEGGVGDLGAGEAQGGEGWHGVGAELDVVEADDGDVAGDTESELADCAHGSDGCEVVGGEDCGGAGAGFEDALHSFVAAVYTVISFLDEGGVFVEMLLRGAFLEGLEAGARGGERERAADEGDAAMAEGGEVLHGVVYSGLVVDLDAAYAGAGNAGVEEDEGDVAVAEDFDEGVIHLGGHDGYAVDLTLEHAGDAELHALGVVVGVRDEDFFAVDYGDVFEGFYEFGEEGVGDVGDDEAVEAGASGSEGAGVGVGIEVEGLDGATDSLGGARADLGRSVHGAGDGGGGDVGAFGDCFDVHGVRAEV